ncbi:MAG TPA: pilus assembly protein TadG-related protein, partial [Candidatus Limnocylindria bacterium]|nr:pilus assembly protein TadG-related protein [Candidatus Limnocylindria bacterium]
MPSSRRRSTRSEGGQAIVILAVAVAGVLAMSALLIDGGNAMAQQRGTQNAADAAAYAGASELLQNIAGTARNDADVESAVLGALAINDTTFEDAWYVDFDGNEVGTVGQGGAIPSSAAGVRVVGQRSMGTYLAGVINMSSIDVSAEATALAGSISGICAAVDGCAM